MDLLIAEKERVLWTQEWAALVQGKAGVAELGYLQSQEYYKRLRELEVKLFGLVY